MHSAGTGNVVSPAVQTKLKRGLFELACTVALILAVHLLLRPSGDPEFDRRFFRDAMLAID